MDRTEDNLRRKQELEIRTRRFAVAVFRFLDQLPIAISSRVIGFQVGKSASSIGANYREANRAESMDDFVHKIGLVLKESSETGYWFDILSDLYPESETVQSLAAEANELTRLFQSTSRTLRTHLSIEKSKNRKIEK